MIFFLQILAKLLMFTETTHLYVLQLKLCRNNMKTCHVFLLLFLWFNPYLNLFEEIAVELQIKILEFFLSVYLYHLVYLGHQYGPGVEANMGLFEWCERSWNGCGLGLTWVGLGIEIRHK